MKFRFTLKDAEQALADSSERYATLMEHGTMKCEIYAPREVDNQKPHAQDEIYVVVKGHGTFLNGRERTPFTEGDFLFVKAGVEHRFEDFTEDLMVWVIFYGPENGEAV